MGRWIATGSLATAHTRITRRRCAQQLVLVAGGHDSNLISASAELYDSASGNGRRPATSPRLAGLHTATLLPNGQVLVAGGFRSTALFNRARNCTIRSPEPGLRPATSTPHALHTATLLPNGKVLVAGGLQRQPFSLATAEFYEPATGDWTATGSLDTARDPHTATLLPNDQVLVAGGNGNNGSLAARNCTIRPPGVEGDRQPRHGTRTKHGNAAAQRKVLVAGGRSQRLYLVARKSTIRRPGMDCNRQPQHNARFSHGDAAAQRQVLVAGGIDSDAIAPRARNCTIRPTVLGQRPVISTRYGGITRRRCCPTARCSSPGDRASATLFLAARNSTQHRLLRPRPP